MCVRAKKNGGAAVSKADRAKAFKAIGAGDVETLQTLLRGDPGIANAVNGDGLTCLDFAVAKRKKGAERALRLAGAAVDESFTVYFPASAPAPSHSFTASSRRDSRRSYDVVSISRRSTMWAG